MKTIVELDEEDLKLLKGPFPQNPCPVTCPGIDYTICMGCDERKEFDEEMQVYKDRGLLPYYIKLLQKNALKAQIENAKEKIKKIDELLPDVLKESDD